MRKFLILGLCLLASPALSAPWKVDATSSKLTFEAEQAGEKFSGMFTRFTPTIELDPAHPEKGRIRVTIDMASATTEDKDRREALPTADWFAIKQFPTAHFDSTSIRATGSDKIGLEHYLAKGTLTIRGIPKEVALGFWLKTSGRQAESRGTLTLNRSDFGVGQGRWLSEEWVKHAVTVHFEIHATQ